MVFLLALLPNWHLSQSAESVSASMEAQNNPLKEYANLSAFWDFLIL